MRGLMLALTVEYCNMEEVMADLQTRLDIDLSRGLQLDLIGEIVGQPRPLSIAIDPDEVFGFDPLAEDDLGFPSGIPPDFGWSGVTRPDRGGVWTGVDGLFVGRMIDADYRTLLRARIFANQADGTVDSIARFLNYALGTTDSNVTNDTVGQVDLVISRHISSVEETIILSLVPVAAGIRVNAIVQPE